MNDIDLIHKLATSLFEGYIDSAILEDVDAEDLPDVVRDLPDGNWDAYAKANALVRRPTTPERVAISEQVARLLLTHLRQKNDIRLGKSEVFLPGQVIAIYQQGVIRSLTFCPGMEPIGELLDGDGELDLADVDGPFWGAMQRYLATHNNSVEWRE